LIDILIFSIVKKKLKNQKFATFSLFAFIILQTIYGGNQPWFDLFSVPFLLLYFYFLLEFIYNQKGKWAFSSGLFFALSFFIKQTALWLLTPFLIISLSQKKEIFKKFLTFFLPTFLFFGFFIFYHHLQKNLINFWFWAFKYPFTILPNMPGHRLFPTAKQTFLYLSPLFILIIFTLLNIKTNIINTSSQHKKIFSLSLAFSLVSLLFCFPRWDIFHLQPAVAFSSLLVAQPILIFRKISQKKPIFKIISFLLLFTLFLNITVITYKNIILKWRKNERFYNQDILEIAAWIKANTQPSDRIFVFNSEENIYFLAQKLPPTPWAINFPWYFEVHGLQEKVIQGLKMQKPKYVIYQPFLSGAKYQIGSYQPAHLAQYIFSNYKKTKEFEIAHIFKRNED
jgi:hypothetical protein